MTLTVLREWETRHLLSTAASRNSLPPRGTSCVNHGLDVSEIDAVYYTFSLEPRSQNKDMSQPTGPVVLRLNSISLQGFLATLMQRPHNTCPRVTAQISGIPHPPNHGIPQVVIQEILLFVRVPTTPAKPIRGGTPLSCPKLDRGILDYVILLVLCVVDLRSSLHHQQQKPVGNKYPT